MPDFYIKAGVGDTIDRFALQIVANAKRNKWDVQGNFNGVTLKATPSSSVGDVMQQWNDATKPLPPMPPPSRTLREGEVPPEVRKKNFYVGMGMLAFLGLALAVTGAVALWGWAISAVLFGTLLFLGALNSRPAS